MIADLKPHSEYKASSQAWLGDVPHHWSVVPNRALFAEVKDRDHPDEEMLSVTITRGIVRQKTLLEGSSKKDSSNLDKSKYKLVEPRDIAYNKMRAWQGAIGASSLRGIISPAYVVMRLRKNDNRPRYFHHLYRTPQFAKEAERWSYGITSDMWSLRPEHFKMIYTPEPPPDEQAAIVRFLDWANGRLERAIRAKRKVIALLNEQKQAIIHCAVTRGIDPSVPLKPSGIPWLGDIPEHWEVKRFARIIADGPRNGISPQIDERGTIESFSISAIRDGRVDVREGDKKYVLGDKAALEKRYQLLRGDVLLVRGNGNIQLVGKAGLVEDDMPGRVYPDLLMRVRLTRPCVPQFLVALLNCPTIRDQIEAVARTAVGTYKINNFQVRQLYFHLPPLEEQQRIIDWLSEALRGIKGALFSVENEISLLREYRTRLVADVVTGKLDVRAAAAKLPETTDDLEPLGDADALTEGDEETGDADLDGVTQEAEA